MVSQAGCSQEIDKVIFAFFLAIIVPKLKLSLLFPEKQSIADGKTKSLLNLLDLESSLFSDDEDELRVLDRDDDEVEVSTDSRVSCLAFYTLVLRFEFGALLFFFTEEEFLSGPYIMYLKYMMCVFLFQGDYLGKRQHGFIRHMVLNCLICFT